MGRLIIVTSAKDGYGKTTVVAMLGTALANQGKLVCVLDADCGYSNLQDLLGLKNMAIYDLYDVITNKCRNSEALIEDPGQQGLYLMPLNEHNNIFKDFCLNFAETIRSLQQRFDYVIVDFPSLYLHKLEIFNNSSLEVVVVTNPTVPAIKSTYLLVQKLKSQKIEDCHFILNRARADLIKKNIMPNINEIEEALEINSYGIVPENDNLLLTSSYASLMLKREAKITNAFNSLACNIVNNNSEHLRVGRFCLR